MWPYVRPSISPYQGRPSLLVSVEAFNRPVSHDCIPGWGVNLSRCTFKIEVLMTWKVLKWNHKFRISWREKLSALCLKVDVLFKVKDIIKNTEKALSDFLDSCSVDGFREVNLRWARVIVISFCQAKFWFHKAGLGLPLHVEFIRFETVPWSHDYQV